MKPVRGLAVAFLMSGLVVAQDGSEAIERARAAHRDILARRQSGDEAVNRLKLEARNAPEKSPERAALVEKLEAAVKEAKSPMGPFIAVFRDVDWSKFDPTADKVILEDGLDGVSADPKHPEKAVAAGRQYLVMFPEGRAAHAIRVRRLPYALLAADKAEEAVVALRDAAATTKEALKAQSLLTLGDLLALLGDVEGAKAAFGEIAATGSKSTAELAAARAAVLGKPAPAIDAKHWIGSEPWTADRLKGKVQLLGFWASWSPSARTCAIDWSGIHDRFVADGLACIGVTRTFGHGYLPGDETQVERGGTSRQGMKPEEYLEHVTAYHTVTKAHYPFVIADEAVFPAYGIKPLPTLVLVGRDGNIALVSTSTAPDDLVMFGIRRLLAAK